MSVLHKNKVSHAEYSTALLVIMITKTILRPLHPETEFLNCVSSEQDSQ